MRAAAALGARRREQEGEAQREQPAVRNQRLRVEPAEDVAVGGSGLLEGDLPEDLYRVMAGLVVKDRETGEAWYDAYSAGIRITGLDHEG